MSIFCKYDSSTPKKIVYNTKERQLRNDLLDCRHFSAYLFWALPHLAYQYVIKETKCFG